MCLRGSLMAMKRMILTIAAAGVVLAAFALMACSDDDDDSSEPTAAPTIGGDGEVDPSVALANPTETASGLKYEDIVVGDGESPATGKQVSVHYTGWLVDGTQFDSSVGGEPITYIVGELSLIDGWEEGLATMKEGGIRKLEIPGELGYGPAGRPPVIPPDATLIFEMELVEVTDP